MGVYIKGMTLKQLEMDNCDDCPIEYFCKYAQSIDVYTLNDGRPTSCPLVEVPEPHGRLIDADLLYDTLYLMWDRSDSEKSEKFEKAVFKMIENASTVIEAEGE